MNFEAHIGFIQEAARFLEIYELDNAFIPTKSKYINLKPKRERTCRFCGLSFPETTFKKEAHLIPEMLGNKTLLSDFECDKCNHYFGVTFENHLANNFSKTSS